MTVTFDTMTLIWGVKQVATPGQEHMIEKARRMHRWVQEQRFKVVLTAPAVAEYLGSFEAKERAAQRKFLVETFPIFPFNMNAADVAAEILAAKGVVEAARKDGGDCSRQIVKADLAIVATAIAHGVGWLFSEDRKVKTIAAGKIIVKKLEEIVPSKPADRTLFDPPSPL